LRAVNRGMMDNPTTLRWKAAHFFEGAAASATPAEAEKLNEVGRQSELWADDLEEMLTYQSKESDRSASGKKAQREPTSS
jgi:hypothetical protein